MKQVIKRIVFLDNAPETEAREDAETVCNMLESNGWPDLLSKVEIIADYAFMPADQRKELVADPSIAILTYSMYTITYLNSYSQIMQMLEFAGRNEIRGKLYIDGSGRFCKILEDLKDFARGDKLWAVMNAVETNNIMTVKDGELKKVNIKLRGVYGIPYELQDIDVFDFFRLDLPEE